MDYHKVTKWFDNRRLRQKNALKKLKPELNFKAVEVDGTFEAKRDGYFSQLERMLDSLLKAQAVLPDEPIIDQQTLSFAAEVCSMFAFNLPMQPEHQGCGRRYMTHP